MGLTKISGKVIKDNCVIAGVVTATAFHGDGSNLTGIDATSISSGNSNVQVVDTGSDGHVKAKTEGTERVRITAAGDVGIGITNPTAKLDVVNDTTNDEEVLRVRGSHGNSGGVVGKTHIGLHYFNASGIDDFSPVRITAEEAAAGSYNADLAFSTRNSGADDAPTERVRITSAGDVGIGTDDPGNHKLHLYGETNSDLRLTATGNDIVNIFADSNRSSANSPIFAIKAEWNGTQVANMKFVAGDDTTNKDDGYITFNTRESGTGASSERLRILSSGNVTIGPSLTNLGKLHVRAADECNFVVREEATSLVLSAETNSGRDNNRLMTLEGSGLVFNSGGAEKLRILSSGGITFNGDTAAANALDDYEEGTWTPRLNGWNGSSYVNVPNTTNASPGHYIKVGRQVTLFIRYEWSSLAVANGNPLYIYDLPFNVTNDHHSAGSMARIGGISNTYDLRIYKYTGSTNILYIQTSQATNPTGMNGNNGQFIAEITYMASS